MIIPPVQEWGHIQKFPLASLKDAVIGVDAAHYLDLRLNLPDSIEPLLNATGGRPYSLKAALRDDIETFKAVDAKLIFVFDGLDHKNKELYTSPKIGMTLKAHKEGWKEYYNEEHDKDVADRTAAAFAEATYPVDKVTRYLQCLLQQHSVPFIVAPYSAAAQLAYLERGFTADNGQHTEFIDTIIGSPEVFLFNVERVITSFGIEQGKATIHALSKSACQDRLDKISDEGFRDVQLLVGGPFLPTFPILERQSSKNRVRDALNLYNVSGRSIPQMCAQYRDEISRDEYEDLYKRAVLSIQHHVVMDMDGKATVMGQEYEGSDAHEFIGLRLPEELYFYISRGIIGPRVTNWLSSGEIDLKLPVGCDDNEAYRRLLGDQLTSLRTQTLCLLSSPLHRFYQTRRIKVKTWFSPAIQTIDIKEELSTRGKISGSRLIDSKATNRVVAPKNESFSYVVDLLTDTERREIVSDKEGAPILRTRSEIVSNVINRFLRLRGFVTEKHELTKWGRALRKSLVGPEARDKLEDSTYLALEMIKFGVVNGQLLSPAVPRSPEDNTDPSKTIVTKIACLGRLKHGHIGYSGPLDREMFAFQFLVDEIRTSLRELLETIFVSMCLSGEIDRDRNDWSEIAFSLPLMNDNGAGLAIAVSTYFDDIKRHGNQSDEPPSEGMRDDLKMNSDLFPKAPNLTKSLSSAFSLWDAVYAGTKELGDEPSARSFAKVDKWLSKMR